MKQYITEKQFNGLSKEAKQKLITWSKTCKSFQDEIFEGGYDPEVILLNIGQMIEFLEEYFAKDESEFTIRFHSAGNGWAYPGQRLVDIDPPIKYEIEDEVDLCDALWEACKKVLEK